MADERFLTRREIFFLLGVITENHSVRETEDNAVKKVCTEEEAALCICLFLAAGTCLPACLRAENKNSINYVYRL
jgi:hypothetical protein